MKKTENTSMSQSLGFPVLLGLGVTLLLMAAGSLVVLSGKADTAQIPLLALLCLGLGSLCAAYIAARRAAKSRLLWGVTSGAALFVCMMVLSLMWMGQPASFFRITVNLAVSLAAACVGGMLGAGMKRKKRRKK